MSAKLTQFRRKAFRSTLAGNVLWGSIGLTLASALAITVATQFSPVPVVANLPVYAQSVPDAASQGVAGYLRAHGAGSTNTAQSVPDANTQSVLAYLDAHRSAAPQTVPDAASQGVTGYLTAHGAGALGQLVPDAATQGVLDYLRAHGVHSK